MTKTQGWIIISILAFAFWFTMESNGNKMDILVNRTVKCVQMCTDKFINSEEGEKSKDNLTACENQCHAETGI